MEGSTNPKLLKIMRLLMPNGAILMIFVLFSQRIIKNDALSRMIRLTVQTIHIRFL